MNLLKNKNGSILLFNLCLTGVVFIIFAGITKIHKNSLNLIDKQNKFDAHGFSIISYYSYVLNEVSWTNKKLKELAIIYSIVNKVKALAPVAIGIKAAVKGLKIYQNLILAKLKIGAKVLDVYIRKKNEINLLPNYHYLTYKRQNKLFSVLNSELIEFKNSIFNSACVKHKNVLSKNKICIYSPDYSKNNKSWFALLQKIHGELSFMITEFIYSIAMLCLIVKAIIILKNDVNIKYDDSVYLSRAVYTYFIDGKCLKKVKCNKKYIVYKNKKIFIKKYKTDNSFRSKFDENYKEIFSQYQKEVATISK